MSEPFRVAVVQFQPDTHTGATHTNLERMSRIVETIGEQKLNLIVFPELGTCGYGIETAAVEAAVESEGTVVAVRHPLCIRMSSRC